jgi:hypothetical protein
LLIITNNAKQKFDEDDVDKPDTDFDNDSDVVCNAIIAHVVKSKLPEGIVTTTDGNLTHALLKPSQWRLKRKPWAL